MAEKDETSSVKKVEIFLILQKSLATLAIHPPKSYEDFRYFYPGNWAFLASTVLGFIATGVFLFNETETIAERSQSVYACTSMTVAFFFYFTFVRKRMVMFNLITNIENVIRKRSEIPASKLSYEETSEKIEKLAQIASFIFLKITPPAILLPNLALVMYTYFAQETLDEGIYRFPYPTWLPFNWKAFPFGYMGTFCIQYIISFYLCCIVFCVMLMFIVPSLILMTITKDIEQEINRSNENLKSKKIQNKHQNEFCDIIQLHAEAKQMFNDLSDIYQVTIAAMFIYGLLSICGTLLMLQSELTRGTVNLDVIDAVIKAQYSFSLIYAFCELSTQLRNHFEEIEKAFQLLDWNLFPIGVQRLLLTVILVAQSPAQVMAFGNVEVNRGNFKKIVNTGFSYFMIMREFR